MSRARVIALIVGVPFLLLAVVVAVVLAAGTLFASSPQVTTLRMPLGDARVADVHLSVSTGTISLTAGSGNLLSGTVTSSLGHPVVTSTIGAGVRQVRVSQSSSTWPSNPFTLRNDWSFQVTRQIPLLLFVHNGSGTTIVDVRGLRLRAATVETGVGDLDVDMRGSWSTSFRFDVQTGDGATIVRLPRDVGVRVRLNRTTHLDAGGVSLQAPHLERRGETLVNGALGRSPITIEIDLRKTRGLLTFTSG